MARLFGCSAGEHRLLVSRGHVPQAAASGGERPPLANAVDSSYSVGNGGSFWPSHFLDIASRSPPRVLCRMNTFTH